jgi:poly-gamma-glutamate system protein
MKKIYWRPQSTPLFAFVLIALFSLAGILAVERYRMEEERPAYREKVEAARLALGAMEAVKDERLRKGITIDAETDPAGSGLIGSYVSAVTTEPGDLDAKQTAVNPNFAAVIVDLLRQAKVKEGDAVAVSFSGSFPALNIAVYAAIRTLGLRPTVISSVGSSQWGANDPAFLWIDMERLLRDRGVFPFRSEAASFGGRHDEGKEMSERGRRAVLDGVARNGLPMITAGTLHGDIDERMAVYFKKDPPKVYINVGGGRAAAGARPFKVLLRPGLLASDLPANARGDSVIARFLKERVPVIQIYDVKRLAHRYGLPIAPASMPQVGEGTIYYATRYNRWLAGSVLALIIFGLFVFSRSDWGFRILQISSRREEIGPPEPMV